MIWSNGYVSPPSYYSLSHVISQFLTDNQKLQLVDLRNDPIDAKDILGADANPLGGILGAALGESAAETQARVEEAKKTATDLTGLVRKKNKDAPAPAPAPAENKEGEQKQEEEQRPQPVAETNGKRKAEEPAEEEESAKKAKVEA